MHPDLLPLLEDQSGVVSRRQAEQVFDRPCWTTVRVARVLARSGLRLATRPCGAGCALRAAA